MSDSILDLDSADSSWLISIMLCNGYCLLLLSDRLITNFPD